MRSIESAIVGAVRNLHSGVFGNTAIAVISDPRGNMPHKVEVILHGSVVARFDARSNGHIANMQITLAGWNTRITRGRLSLLIRHAALVNGLHPDQYPRGLGVSSRAGIIRIHDMRGETVIDDSGWYGVHV